MKDLFMISIASKTGTSLLVVHPHVKKEMLILNTRLNVAILYEKNNVVVIVIVVIFIGVIVVYVKCPINDDQLSSLHVHFVFVFIVHISIDQKLVNTCQYLSNEALLSW